MMSQPEIRESLLMFAQTLDPILQKVVVKIIFCMMDTKELKYVLKVCFVALRPKSTAMVMARLSVHLTTLFPGQA